MALCVGVTCPPSSASQGESPAGSAPPPAPGPLRAQLDELVRSGLMVGPGPELGRGLLPQTPVGPLVVVIVPPRAQRGLDVDETQEPMLREALLPESAIEGLNEGIVGPVCPAG
jgi:hypothetical protein